MAQIVQQLREEHANMARLLNVFERQLDRYRSGAQPDYDIIEGLVDYFLDYPDSCHHPKEDLIVRKMVEQGTDRTKPLEGLAAQHSELAALTRRFATVVRRLLEDEEFPRETLLESGREFLDAQRHHMQMEDEYFLPLVESVLGPEQLAELDAELEQRSDPLFGGESEQQESRFAVLHANILAWEQEDQVPTSTDRGDV